MDITIESEKISFKTIIIKALVLTLIAVSIYLGYQHIKEYTTLPSPSAKSLSQEEYLTLTEQVVISFDMTQIAEQHFISTWAGKYGLSDEDISYARQIDEKTPLDIKYAVILMSYTKKLNLPPSLLLALFESESDFNPTAVSPVNAKGIGQVRKVTEKWILERYGHLLDLTYNHDRIFEPEYNLGCATLVLYDMYERYGDDNIHKILTEYNQGIGNAQKYYKKHSTYVSGYSRKIIRNTKKYEKLIGFKS
jgi:hypothetical protein